MPRQLDLTPTNLAIDHNPLIQLAITPEQIKSVITGLPKLTWQQIVDAINQLLDWIDQVTGLDLLALAKALEDMFGITSGLLTTLLDNLVIIGEQFLNDLLSLFNNPLGLGTGLIDITAWATGFINEILTPTGLLASLQTIIDAILNSIGLGAGAGTITQLTNYFNDLVALLSNPVGLGSGTIDVNAWASDFINSVLTPTGLLSQMFSALIPSYVPVSHIGSIATELLQNPTFDTAAALNGGGIWSFAPTITHTAGSTGSATVLGDGTLKQLLSDPPIMVAPNQTLNISQWLQWNNIAASGQAFALMVIGYLGSTIASTTTLASITNPPATYGWTQLAGTYTVPAGVDRLRVALQVLPGVSAGQSWWDDASAQKPGTSMAQSLVTNLVSDLSARLLITDYTNLLSTLGLGTPTLPAITTRLQNLAGTGTFNAAQLANIANIPMLAQASVTNLIADLAARALAADLTNLMSTLGAGTPTLPAITTRLQNLATGGTFNAAQLSNITNIPQLLNTSVAGIGGTPNMGSALQQTWDTVANSPANSGTLALIQTRLQNLTTSGLLNAATGLTGLVPIGQIPTASLNRTNILDLGTTYQAATNNGTLHASMSRQSSSHYDLSTNVPAYTLGGYFDLTNNASPGITSAPSSAKFTVSTTGYYRCDICYKIAPAISAIWQIAPALFKNNVLYKMGADGTAFNTLGAGVNVRWIHSSFTVQLNSGDYVQAGVHANNATGLISGVLTGEATGTEAYFTISLTNQQVT